MYKYECTRQRIPVGVEDGTGVSAEQGNNFGQLPALVEGDNSEGATTTGFVVDREVLGIGLGEASAGGVRRRDRSGGGP